MKYLLHVLCLVLLATAVPLQARAVNGAPVAENLKLETYRGITMCGQLRATDPENDALCYKLCTPPGKGKILLSPDGSFTYTPEKRKWGKDYFGYTATDSAGNISHEATVIISLKRQKNKVNYRDLSGHPAEYAAAVLAEQGLFVGEILGGNQYFFPEMPVNRREFQSLCSAIGAPAPCADSDALSPITFAQAAVMLTEALDLHTATAIRPCLNTPSWAQIAFRSLIACRILPRRASPEQLLTRSGAAQLLMGALQFRDA